MSAREFVVYVVDDDDAVRQSLEWLLSGADFVVKTFASADQFLDNLDPDTRGCLIADVRMPGMSGFELQKEMAARSIGLPVIIVTGHSDLQMATRAKSAGALEFLEKPIDDQMLIDVISRIAGGNAGQAS